MPHRQTFLLAAILLASCSTEADVGNEPAAEAADPNRIGAPLLNRNGQPSGEVLLTQDSTGLTLKVDVAGLEPGQHGVHLHAVGRCEAPSFEGAGLHWNPTGRKHGRDNLEGAHLGDLANLDVGADGRGSSTFGLPGQRLRDGRTPLIDLDGAAVVIHERADDYKTDPSGSSGDRLACAVLAD